MKGRKNGWRKRKGREGQDMERELEDSTEDSGDRLSDWLAMAGHLCCDINQGVLAAVLPFLVAADGYTYAQVSLLMFASNVASAVIQPLLAGNG